MCGSISSSTKSVPSPLGRAGHVAKAGKTKPREAVDGARSQQRGRISAELQHRAGHSPAAKGRGRGCTGSWCLSSALVFQWVFQVMETQNLTCLHPPPHPTTQQSSRNAQNPQLTPRWRHPPPKLWCPRAPVRAERRKQPFPSSPIQQNSLEQAGSIIHAGNKAVVVSWALGELGGEFLFFK